MSRSSVGPVDLARRHMSSGRRYVGGPVIAAVLALALVFLPAKTAGPAAALPPLAPSLGPSPQGLAQSWVAGFHLSGHIFHPGQRITGTITVLAKRCFQFNPCYSGTDWPRPCRPTALTCTWIAGEATNQWQVYSAAIGNGVGPAHSDDFYAIIGRKMHVLDGFVRDAAAKGIAGVDVSIAGASSYRAVTDGNGYYNALLPNGSYRVSAPPAGAFTPPEAHVILHDHASADFRAATCALNASAAPRVQSAAAREKGVGSQSAAAREKGVGSQARSRAGIAPRARPSAVRAMAPAPSCQAAVSIEVTPAGAQLHTTVTVHNTGALALTELQLQQHVFPAYNVAKPTAVSDLGKISTDVLNQVKRWVITWRHARLDAGASWAVSYDLSRRAVVAKQGETLSGIQDDHWATGTTAGWLNPSPAPTLSFNDAQDPVEHDMGSLLYSDGPESICGYGLSPAQAKPLGAKNLDAVEGVLYRGTLPHVPFVIAPFRVYLNHENHTHVSKDIYVVISAASSTITVVRHAFGLDVLQGSNPVKAGRVALDNYLRSRQQNVTQTYTISGTASRAFRVATLSNYGSILNGLYDFTPSGPVTVTTVVVNSASTKTQGSAVFAKNPTAYHFNGQKSRPFNTDPPLSPAGCSKNTHIRGTYNYDEITVTFPPYNLDSGARYGWRLADDAKHDSSQYQAALDETGCPNNPTCLNIGNYGVIYHVIIPLVASSPDEMVQVLFNPRVQGAAFAGTAMILKPDGAQGPIRLPLGDATVKDTNDAIGLTRVAAGTAPLSFEFMAPGGVTLPAAVVLTPAYIRSDAAVAWSGVAATTPVTDTLVTPLTP